MYKFVKYIKDYVNYLFATFPVISIQAQTRINIRSIEIGLYIAVITKSLAKS
jgi:hypothetical protein